MSNFRGMDFHGFVVKVKILHFNWLFQAAKTPWTALTRCCHWGSWLAEKQAPSRDEQRMSLNLNKRLEKKYQMGKNLKYLHVEGWNRFVLVLAAMPSFQLEDVRCRLSSSSKTVGLLPGYCAVAWKTVRSLSQNLYCWVSQIITPQVTLHRIPLENVREKRGWI